MTFNPDNPNMKEISLRHLHLLSWMKKPKNTGTSPNCIWESHQSTRPSDKWISQQTSKAVPQMPILQKHQRKIMQDCQPRISRGRGRHI